MYSGGPKDRKDIVLHQILDMVAMVLLLLISIERHPQNIEYESDGKELPQTYFKDFVNEAEMRY